PLPPAAQTVAPRSTPSAPLPAVAAAERETAAVLITPVARPRISVAAAAPALPRATDIRERVARLPLAEPAPTPARAPRTATATPVALQRVQPEYPVHEKIRGVTGQVDLQFGIDSDGRVRDVTVLSSTPDHVFDRVAIAALQQWRFVVPDDASQRYTQ